MENIIVLFLSCRLTFYPFNLYCYFARDNSDFFKTAQQIGKGFIEETLTIEENRGLFFEDITKLVSKFKDKLGIKGYLSQQKIST